MSDEQLIRLLREKPPEEFTSDEITLVRRRLPHCSELRQAVADHLELEQVLYHARGGVRFSVDDLLRRAALTPASRGPAGIYGWPTAAAVLLTLSVVGAVIYARGNRRPAEIAQAGKAAGAGHHKPDASPSTPNGNQPVRHVVRKPPIGTEKPTASSAASVSRESTGDEPGSMSAVRAGPTVAISPPTSIATPEQLAGEKTAADNPAGPEPVAEAWLTQRVEIDNEARRASAELAAAIEHRAWRDACRVIVAAAANHGDGLAPGGANGRLCSFNLMVFEAIRTHAGLRQAMCDDYAVDAWRGFRGAADRDDAAAMAAVAGQFIGTPAATAARQWLGDRALSAGRFHLALAHFRAAAERASDQQCGGLLARVRLCGALLGRELGEPVTETVELEGEQLSPFDFERLVTEMRMRAVPNSAASESSSSPALTSEIQKARSQSIAGDLLITISDERGHIATAWQRRTGDMIWRQQLDGINSAAPAIVDDRLFVCLAVPDSGGGRRMYLSTLAAHTGEVVARRPLARLAADESGETSVRIETAEGALVVTVGDLRFHADLEGCLQSVTKVADGE